MIYQFIEEQKMFDQFRGKEKNVEEKKSLESEFNKIIITEQSDAFAIPFSVPVHEEEKYKQEIEELNKIR